MAYIYLKMNIYFCYCVLKPPLEGTKLTNRTTKTNVFAGNGRRCGKRLRESRAGPDLSFCDRDLNAALMRPDSPSETQITLQRTCYAALLYISFNYVYKIMKSREYDDLNSRKVMDESLNFGPTCPLLTGMILLGSTTLTFSQACTLS